MKKKMAMLVLAGVLAASSLTGCGGIKDSDVVATVGDDEITAAVANFYARYTQAQYETYYSGYLGEDMWTTEATEGKTYEESVKETVIESLEDSYLMESHMKDYEVSLSDEEKQAIKDAAADFDEANGLEEKEKVSGDTKTVERVLTLLTIQSKVQAAIEATVDTEVSDEEAAQKKMSYVSFPFTTTDADGNSVDLTDEEKATLKESAQAFADGAKAAADFPTYATEQGYTASDATFDATTETLSTDLVAAADKLEVGGTTDLIEDDNGYYVARLTSLFDQEATNAQKETIVSQRKQDAVEKALEEWKDEVEIKVDDKVWAKVDFNDLQVTMKQEEADPYADEVKTDDQAEAEENANADSAEDAAE